MGYIKVSSVNYIYISVVALSVVAALEILFSLIYKISSRIVGLNHKIKKTYLKRIFLNNNFSTYELLYFFLGLLSVISIGIIDQYRLSKINVGSDLIDQFNLALYPIILFFILVLKFLLDLNETNPLKLKITIEKLKNNIVSLLIFSIITSFVYFSGIKLDINFLNDFQAGSYTYLFPNWLMFHFPFLFILYVLFLVLYFNQNLYIKIFTSKNITRSRRNRGRAIVYGEKLIYFSLLGYGIIIFCGAQGVPEIVQRYVEYGNIYHNLITHFIFLFKIIILGLIISIINFAFGKKMKIIENKTIHSIVLFLILFKTVEIYLR